MKEIGEIELARFRGGYKDRNCEYHNCMEPGRFKHTYHVMRDGKQYTRAVMFCRRHFLEAEEAEKTWARLRYEMGKWYSLDNSGWYAPYGFPEREYGLMPDKTRSSCKRHPI